MKNEPLPALPRRETGGRIASQEQTYPLRGKSCHTPRHENRHQFLNCLGVQPVYFLSNCLKYSGLFPQPTRSETSYTL
jgi:hypothetical protein